MDEFYLYLPSSVVSSTYNNTISHFQTRLATPIQTRESSEVALVKLIYPSSAINIYDGVFEFYDFGLKLKNFAHFPNGYYTLQSFVDTFSKLIGDNKQYYKLSFNENEKIFLLDCTSPDEKENPELFLSKNLQSYTGFPQFINSTGVYKSSDSFDITGGLHNMYVYCDIIRNVNIGNTMAPLLSVITYYPNQQREIEYQPRALIYSPIADNIVQNVKIEIRAKTGIYFPFTTGEAIVVLHIRTQRPRL